MKDQPSESDSLKTAAFESLSASYKYYKSRADEISRELDERMKYENGERPPPLPAKRPDVGAYCKTCGVSSDKFSECKTCSKKFNDAPGAVNYGNAQDLAKHVSEQIKKHGASSVGIDMGCSVQSMKIAKRIIELEPCISTHDIKIRLPKHMPRDRSAKLDADFITLAEYISKQDLIKTEQMLWSGVKVRLEHE